MHVDPLQILLSVWAVQNWTFLGFGFYVSIGMLLKGVTECSLLSKDMPLNTNIDKVMPV